MSGVTSQGADGARPGRPDNRSCQLPLTLSVGLCSPVSGPANAIEMLLAGVIGASSERRACRKFVWNALSAFGTGGSPERNSTGRQLERLELVGIREVERHRAIDRRVVEIALGQRGVIERHVLHAEPRLESEGRAHGRFERRTSGRRDSCEQCGPRRSWGAAQRRIALIEPEVEAEVPRVGGFAREAQLLRGAWTGSSGRRPDRGSGRKSFCIRSVSTESLRSAATQLAKVGVCWSTVSRTVAASSASCV